MSRVLLEQTLTIRVAGLERDIEIKIDDRGRVNIAGSLDVWVLWPTWPPRDPEPGDLWVRLSGMPSELEIDVRREGNRNWFVGAGTSQYPGLDVDVGEKKFTVTARGGSLQEYVEVASVPV